MEEFAAILARFLAIGQHSSRPTSTRENGFRLSYNAYCADTGQDETAIVVAEEWFLILYGDHREELKGKGLKEAMEYWKEREELWGATTNTIEEIGGVH